ncbi:MAG: hypothetical protein ABEL97_00785 [Salinibacter sp.]
MSDARDRQYEQTRRRFDELDVEAQSRFLVEAAASTLAQGVVQAGSALAEGLEDALRRARRHDPSASSGPGPGAAEPETAHRRQPRSGSGDEDVQS